MRSLLAVAAIVFFSMTLAPTSLADTPASPNTLGAKPEKTTHVYLWVNNTSDTCVFVIPWYQSYGHWGKPVNAGGEGSYIRPGANHNFYMWMPSVSKDIPVGVRAQVVFRPKDCLGRDLITLYGEKTGIVLKNYAGHFRVTASGETGNYSVSTPQ
jgi:hypothetical protein